MMIPIILFNLLLRRLGGGMLAKGNARASAT
jgi:hypothetical protein